MSWWVHSAYESGGIVLVVSWSFWVIFSICLHELAHGWAAIANGDDTPRRLGHMTIDPLVHMGWTSLIFFAIAGIAWGLMPTDRSRYRNPRLGRVMVAVAGPAMNVALGVVALTLAALWTWATDTGRIDVAAQTADNVTRFLYVGGFLNFILCVFNLLPVPPLDGSQVLAGASRTLDRFYSQPAVQMYGMLVVLFLFFTSIDAPLQRGAARAAMQYAGWVESLLPARGEWRLEDVRDDARDDAEGAEGAAGDEGAAGAKGAEGAESRSNEPAAAEPGAAEPVAAEPAPGE